MSDKSLKKKILTMTAFFTACGLIGGVCGVVFGSVGEKEFISNMIKAVKAHGLIPSAAFFAVVNIALGSVSLVKYLNSKKLFLSVQKDDDDSYMAVEHSLNKPVLFSGILTIFNVTMMPVIFQFTVHSSLSEKHKLIFTSVCVAFYIIFILFSFILSRCIVELIKKINPEKKGDLLDFNFQKNWENSSDEAEKLMMYKAAYKSFKAVKYACIALWAVCFISQVLFKTGILPGICVGIIFTVSTISYSLEADKLTR